MGIDEISDRQYNLYMGLCLLWGFVLNAILIKSIDMTFVLQTKGSYIGFIIIYFVVCFIGVMLFQKSDNPFISFLGYNLIAVPFGLVLDLIVTPFAELGNVVFFAMVVTAGITVIMILLGTIYPDFFLSLGRTLFISLLVSIIVELVASLLLGLDLTIIDYVVALIFSGYIGYDWARAMEKDKTVDNAIDSACDLYMDIINLFIRILEIMGRSKKR